MKVLKSGGRDCKAVSTRNKAGKPVFATVVRGRSLSNSTSIGDSDGRARHHSSGLVGYRTFNLIILSVALLFGFGDTLCRLFRLQTGLSWHSNCNEQPQKQSAERDRVQSHEVPFRSGLKRNISWQ